MAPPIFVDTNIPIYTAGRPHAPKEPCSQVLLLIEEAPQRFFTDAEVVKDLLHRYIAPGLWPQGRVAISECARLMVDRIEPVTAEDVLDAAELADRCPGMSARDLLHVAIMTRLGADALVSADRDFERVANVRRLDPADVGSWRELL